MGDKNIAGDSKKEVETRFLTIPNDNLIKNKQEDKHIIQIIYMGVILK